MSKIVEPKENIIYSKNLYLQRLKDCNELKDLFIETITSIIAPKYDEINRCFAERLVEIDLKGYDEYGYFTLGKEIWTIFKRDDNSLVGFEVITRKRGGSIKLGPTYIKPEHRGNRFSKEVIETLCNEYVSYGARKVYVTAPLEHIPTAILDFEHLKFKLEAVLNSHYSETSSERVCGKVIKESFEEEAPVLRISIGKEKVENIQYNFSSISFGKLKDFIFEYMSINFGDIDDVFVRSIWNNVATENIKKEYEKKEKDIFLSEKNSKINALVVACSKRGGNYKISPFLIANDFLNEENIQMLVENIEERAWKIKRRKITFFIPIDEVIISNVLSRRNYYSEGILREPYKMNKDFIVFSKFGGNH